MGRRQPTRERRRRSPKVLSPSKAMASSPRHRYRRRSRTGPGVGGLSQVAKADSVVADQLPPARPAEPRLDLVEGLAARVGGVTAPNSGCLGCAVGGAGSCASSNSRHELRDRLARARPRRCRTSSTQEDWGHAKHVSGNRDPQRGRPSFVCRHSGECSRGAGAGRADARSVQLTAQPRASRLRDRSGLQPR